MSDAEHLRLQAQTWAQEARTQRATVHEMYELITGKKGEPGDWNGSEPLRAFLAADRTTRAALADELNQAAFHWQQSNRGRTMHDQHPDYLLARTIERVLAYLRETK